MNSMRSLVPSCLLGLALLWLPACTTAGLSTASSAADSPRERVNFDANWRFAKGDPAEAGTTLSYASLKAPLLANAASADFVVSPYFDGNPGKDVSYAQPGFNDSGWRQLNLPHDWAIEGPFDMRLAGATGKLPYFGAAWYRKTFAVPAGDFGKRISLEIDGAMAYASVWLNGVFIGGWPYGYASFTLDLTSQIRPGANNVLAIRLDNPNSSSRWYPGGGIYRNVWLVKTAPVHVAHWGAYVTTPKISTGVATVNVRVNVDNEFAASVGATVCAQLFAVGADGQLTGPPLATTNSENLMVDGGGTKTADLTVSLARPNLWSLAKPNLYAAVTTVSAGGSVVDRLTTKFGVRTLTFDPDHGFLLNGEHIRVNGVCNHSDLGPLGSAINVRGLERQIQLLQEMGCNAIRTSHNMPSPELLDLCDRMGMLVMDESFDCWARQKTQNDYHLLWPDWHEKDIRAEVRRDRNHPSVFMYSVGNEIPEQGSPRGNEILAELIKFVRAEDPTRMVVTANNNNGFSGFASAEYVYGFNYEPQKRITYESYHAQNPTVALIGSETASCISSRGVYVYPVTDNKSGGGAPDHQMSSYDLYAPNWADAPDLEFAAQDKNPFVAGEFVWTGFDYIGEPTNNTRGGTDTSRSSYFGIIDLDGFKKDRFYIYQAHWRPDLPMAHLVPQNWNWKGAEGQVTPVHVYTSGDEAELFLNGVSQGRKKKGQFEYRIRWDDVKYQPGELHIVAYKNGVKLAEDTVKTTGAAAKVAIAPDRATIARDGADLSYVTVSIKDAAGLTVPDAMNKLHYEISGPGEIVAVDNGDATSLAPIQGTSDSKAFNGLAQVIVRAKAGQTGTITLRAQSDGLTAASVAITSQ